jgi:hypothetical protein
VSLTNLPTLLALLYDVRGFSRAIVHERYFDAFYQWLAAVVIPILKLILSSANELVSSALALVCELSCDNLQRVSKRTKIVLHRSLVDCIQAYLAIAATQENAYETKYKPLGKAIKAFSDILTDKDTRENYPQTVQSVILTIVALPVEEVSTYSTVFARVYHFIEYLTSRLFQTFAALPPDHVSIIFTIIGEGCQSFSLALQMLSYTTIGTIARRIGEDFARYSEFLGVNQVSFNKLLRTLFLVFISGEQINQS